MIGTSDQPCWLAEACKIPSLEDVWTDGVTVSRAVNIRGYRNKTRLCNGRMNAFASPTSVESFILNYWTAF